MNQHFLIILIKNKYFTTWSEWRLTVISATRRVEMGIVSGVGNDSALVSSIVGMII